MKIIDAQWAVVTECSAQITVPDDYTPAQITDAVAGYAKAGGESQAAPAKILRGSLSWNDPVTRTFGGRLS